MKLHSEPPASIEGLTSRVRPLPWWWLPGVAARPQNSLLIRSDSWRQIITEVISGKFPYRGSSGSYLSMVPTPGNPETASVDTRNRTKQVCADKSLQYRLYAALRGQISPAWIYTTTATTTQQVRMSWKRHVGKSQV